MRTLGIPIFLCLVLFHCQFANADLLDDAEQSFRSGNHGAAQEKYLDIIQKNQNKNLGFLLYNVGTVALSKGDAAIAYAYLTKARFADPFDSDILHNQQAAKMKLSGTAINAVPSSWISWWPENLRVLPINLFLTVALLLSSLWLGTILLSRPQFQVVFASAFTLSLAILALQVYQIHTPLAGIVRASTLKSGPGTAFSDITKMEPGAIVSFEEARDGWAKLRFRLTGSTEEIVGWLELSSVLPFNS